MPTQRPTASPIQTASWTHSLPERFSVFSDSDFPEDFSNLSDQELRLWQQFEDEIYYLHQLAAEQEAALLQLMSMVEQLQADRDRASSVWATDNLAINDLAINDLAINDLAAGQPLEPEVAGKVGQRRVTEVLQVAQHLLEGIGGAIVLLGVAIGDRIHASRSNASRANVSKRNASRSNASKRKDLIDDPTPASAHRLIGLRRWAVSSPEGSSDRSSDSKLHLKDSEADPIEILPTLQEALTLTLGAAILRVILDHIVQFYPALWFISVLLMVVPAAVAVYRTHRFPRSGFLWGFRLTLILVGLLLGRRM
ncbi:hypothetical protein [Leptolyngbya ohadii]|uniref:hypothetical protein n=1 Tax=Leptolyngbya ohadii TaxID=1962290 RepID=UPI000B59D48D|nr:hypothetical protein [Leptolyngbya ohadii]